MTAIVAIAKDNKVYMGGDSAGVAGLSIVVRKDHKVFHNKDFIIGFTSSFRMGNILRWSFDPPDHPARMGVERYMNTLFIDAVREAFRTGGYAMNSQGKEQGGSFIVGYRGRLFTIDSDYQVGIPAESYASVGCGFELCYGSLHTTESMDIDPKKRIKIALSAAEKFSGGVVSRRYCC